MAAARGPRPVRGVALVAADRGDLADGRRAVSERRSRSRRSIAVCVINAGVAGTLTWFGWVGEEQHGRRARELTELTRAHAELERRCRERRAAAAARRPGARGRRRRRAPPDGARDPRHDRPGVGRGSSPSSRPRSAPAPIGDRPAGIDARVDRDRTGPLEPERGAALGAGARARAARRARGCPRPCVRSRIAGRRCTASRSTVATTGNARPMRPELEVALLRTAQEALANVAKHAHANRVGLTLSYMEDQVTLDVRDDGVGFATVNGTASGAPASARRRRLRADGDAPAGRGRGGQARDRIRTGRRDRDQRLGPRDLRHERRGSELAPIRVMIVDDHPVVRNGLIGMFEGEPGFEVVGDAGDGAEAVRRAGALAPGRDPDGPADARDGRRRRRSRRWRPRGARRAYWC